MKTNTSKQNKLKSLGQTFTPLHIVDQMLDLISYNNSDILNKIILEPSCGDGAFLLRIVERIILQAQNNNYKEEDIVKILENNIIGIEIDNCFYKQCLDNLNNLANKYLIKKNIKWQIYNQDALSTKIKAVDFIVGNPPYIRIHNLEQQNRDFIKNYFQFCSSGTTDVYIAFYEFAIKNIKEDGKICFITPNSFLRNKSSKYFREYITKHKLLNTIIDFGNYQLFNKVSTYVAICVLSKNCNKSKYYKWQENKIEYISDINLQDFYKQDWCFDIKKTNDNFFKLDKIDFIVSYGIATLRDKIYISNVDNENENNILFNGFLIEKAITKPVIKASLTNPKKQRIIYPYLEKNIPIDEVLLERNFPLCYKYLSIHKQDLLQRDIDNRAENWYQYGRSQAIKHMNNEKLAISTIVKDKVHMRIVDDNTMVYSGIFAISKHLQDLQDILQSDKFLSYILTVGKDMQNGYKNFNTKHIKYFLENYL